MTRVIKGPQYDRLSQRQLRFLFKMTPIIRNCTLPFNIWSHTFRVHGHTVRVMNDCLRQGGYEFSSGLISACQSICRQRNSKRIDQKSFSLSPFTKQCGSSRKKETRTREVNWTQL